MPRYDFRSPRLHVDAPLAPGATVLLDIETEVAITGISVAGDDMVVTSALNGLAAFRLNADRLASQK